jgi:predicted DNA-binding transcriptional regulator AlpA
MSDERILREQEVALLIGVSVHTLRAWRWRREEGPAYFKVGSCVRYHLSSVEAYLDRHRIDPDAKSKIQPARGHGRSTA